MKRSIFVLGVLLVFAALAFGTGTDEESVPAEQPEMEPVSFPLAQPLELHFILQTRLHDDLNELEIFQRMQESTNVFVN